MPPSSSYVSRGGEKLAAALDAFGVSVEGRVCADLGCHVGGFVDCLLRRGAARVYAVDTGYGILAWKLRKDARVVVMERTNAMHVEIDAQVEVVTIDAGWTRQAKILPNVARFAAPDAEIVTLIKPHYEAPKQRLRAGVLPDEETDEIVRGVLDELAFIGWATMGTIKSPLRGHGGNREVLARLRKA